MNALVPILLLAGLDVGPLVRFPGTCDASAAVALEGGRLAVANDEDNVIRLYEMTGRLVGSVTSPSLGGKEADIEGAARISAAVYWLTSHGRNKDGEERPARRRFFSTKISQGGSGLEPASTTISLFDSLVAHATIGPFLGDAARKAPEAEGGLNIEGLAEGGPGTLLFAFRNPVPSGRALILPFENPDAALTGATPKLGSPIYLDLGGLGVRSLERVGEQYWILAGPSGGTGAFRLFRWDGAGPAQLFVDLSTMPELAPLRPEAMLQVRPGRLLMLSDDGDELVDGSECKEAPVEKRSFRGVELSVIGT